MPISSTLFGDNLLILDKKIFLPSIGWKYLINCYIVGEGANEFDKICDCAITNSDGIGCDYMAGIRIISRALTLDFYS